MSEDRTEVVWTQHTEPGGFIPGLVNLLLVDIPHQSLMHLESVANRLPYRTARLIRNETAMLPDWLFPEPMTDGSLTDPQGPVLAG